MPKRRPIGFMAEFTGLNLNDSEYTVGADEAIEADNVFTESGRVEIRPGRVELSEDQLSEQGSLGLFNYTPPTATTRSIIIVRPDGIFQRIG